MSSPKRRRTVICYINSIWCFYLDYVPTILECIWVQWSMKYAQQTAISALRRLLNCTITSFTSAPFILFFHYNYLCFHIVIACNVRCNCMQIWSSSTKCIMTIFIRFTEKHKLLSYCHMLDSPFLVSLDLPKEKK